ncbi:MAG: hypothetical protein IJ870_05795 [Alphaproteobacteria bacterium]|nr:hypothetical protein [Alphaproteobacteria bacterium]
MRKKFDYWRIMRYAKKLYVIKGKRIAQESDKLFSLRVNQLSNKEVCDLLSLMRGYSASDFKETVLYTVFDEMQSILDQIASCRRDRIFKEDIWDSEIAQKLKELKNLDLALFNRTGTYYRIKIFK